MNKVVIVAAKRTPIGKFLGSFEETSAADLAVAVVMGMIDHTGIDPTMIEEVIWGNARQAGNGPNIGRQVSVRSGIPQESPAYTINKACASSLKSISNAYQTIAFGDADVIVAGGSENMTRVPFLLDHARMGYRLGHQKLIDGMYQDGFLCPLTNRIMGETAENLAEKYHISRQEQDEFAVESQHKCERARQKGLFEDEIIPVVVKKKRQEKTIVRDEHPRDGATVESLQKLKPVFKEEGTVHAGNSSGITDGAAALLLMSERKAIACGLKPMAEVVAAVSVGVDPAYMGIGPVPAIKKLERKTGISLDEYDLIELNEAFAAQVIACDRECAFDRSKMNVNGGAIALGHPIGATGARIAVTLVHEMVRRQSGYGLATLCVSGGLGMAVAFKGIS